MRKPLLPGCGQACSWARLAAASTLLVTSAQGLWTTGLTRGGPAAGSPHIRAGKRGAAKSQAAPELEPLAPLVVHLDRCTDTFKKLVDGIVMSILLGMRVLLSSADATLDMQLLSSKVNALYNSRWCDKKTQSGLSLERSSWCAENSFNSFIMLSVQGMELLKAQSETDSNVTILDIIPKATMDRHDLNAFHRDLSTALGSRRNTGSAARSFMRLDCAVFNLKVEESDAELWSLWWRVSEALEFADPIKGSAALFIAAIEAHGEESRRRAGERGFPPSPGPPAHGRAFNVLHVRIDRAWVQECGALMGADSGPHRSNCVNNTQNIAEVLVTEGVDPRLPLYVDIPHTLQELSKVGAQGFQGQYGPGFQGLMEAFTVITKGAILRECELRPDAFSPDQWSAVDLLVASAANDYVGNSVAADSAYIITARRHHGKSAWHYNGGCTPMRESGALRPFEPLSVPTFRAPLKWVFTIHVGGSSLSASFVDMVKVAVLSAREHTSLIPVCITSEQPTSALSTWLVSHGVRVVHHAPTWAPAMTRKVWELLNSPIYEKLKFSSHLYADPDAMVGTFMRIDLPIIGILDEFVLYTDVDVLFQSEINWRVLLAGTDLGAIHRMNDFARGKQSFAPSGRPGLPRYLAASSEIKQSKDPRMMNAGVMLLNLRSLRETYESFKEYILNDPDLYWEEGPGDQGAFKSFYADSYGRPQFNFLRYVLNWKPYWPGNPDAKIIHFHGPKCSRDVEPYFQTRAVHTELFGFLLERCAKTGNCESLCHKYEGYLSLAAQRRDP